MQVHAIGEASPSPVPTPEHQLDLVRGSIALLTTRAARRITLVGIGSAETTLLQVRALAESGGLTMRVASRGAVCDITLEAPA